MVRRSDQQSLVIWTTLLCIKSSFSRYRTIRHGGYGSLFSLFGQALAGLQQGDLQLGTHLLLLSRDGKGAGITVCLRFGHNGLLSLLVSHPLAVQHIINHQEHIPPGISFIFPKQSTNPTFLSFLLLSAAPIR